MQQTKQISNQYICSFDLSFFFIRKNGKQDVEMFCIYEIPIFLFCFVGYARQLKHYPDLYRG